MRRKAFKKNVNSDPSASASSYVQRSISVLTAAVKPSAPKVWLHFGEPFIKPVIVFKGSVTEKQHIWEVKHLCPFLLFSIYPFVVVVFYTHSSQCFGLESVSSVLFILSKTFNELFVLEIKPGKRNMFFPHS